MLLDILRSLLPIIVFVLIFGALLFVMAHGKESQRHADALRAIRDQADASRESYDTRL